MTTNGNEWYNEWQRVVHGVTTSDNEWERVAKNDNEWQRVTASGTTNENSTVHFKEWLTAILSMTKTENTTRKHDKDNTSRDGWLQLKWLNKHTSLKVFQESSWS